MLTSSPSLRSRRRAATRTISAADLFCGAGGTSTGLVQACEDLELKVDLLAINHWPVAIATHSKNHPWARHLCASLDSVDPRKVVPGGHLDLLVASPECTHHSVARGGRPINDQSRASAWHVLRWAEHLSIDSILIENVREFRNWGPLDSRQRPLKKRRGNTYQAFLSALRSLGYRVEDRVLNAADYGDATTRERLFVIARRGNRKIRWPEASHVRERDLFNADRAPWRAAREIIDWSQTSKSIFNRKRPLAPSTIERIASGLKRFGGAAAEPFLVMLYGTGKAASIDKPLPTVTANGQHIALCEPFVLGRQGGGAPRRRPLPAVATTGAPGVEPFLVRFNGGRGGRTRVHGVDRPMPTQDTANRYGLVEPFIISAGGPEGQGRRARSVKEPLPTILAEDHKALVEPYIVPLNHGKGDRRAYRTDRPMPTVTTLDAWGLVEPYLVKYYGTAKHAQSVREPLDTVTAKDRFALVEPGATTFGLDIRFRMLRPHELARSMSFDDYAFTGNREEQVRQIGNAVPVRTAKALCRAILES